MGRHLLTFKIYDSFTLISVLNSDTNTRRNGKISIYRFLKIKFYFLNKRFITNQYL